MPNNVGLYNVDVSSNQDTYIIVDNNAGGQVIARPTIRGSDTYRFNCASDDQGYGDLDITNVESGVPNHFSFVRDDQVLSL
jgi:hypothetical protein